MSVEIEDLYWENMRLLDAVQATAKKLDVDLESPEAVELRESMRLRRQYAERIRLLKSKQLLLRAHESFVEIEQSDWENAERLLLSDKGTRRVTAALLATRHERRERTMKIWAPIISAIASLAGAFIGAKLGKH